MLPLVDSWEAGQRPPSSLTRTWGFLCACLVQPLTAFRLVFRAFLVLVEDQRSRREWVSPRLESSTRTPPTHLPRQRRPSHHPMSFGQRRSRLLRIPAGQRLVVQLGQAALCSVPAGPDWWYLQHDHGHRPHRRSAIRCQPSRSATAVFSNSASQIAKLLRSTTLRT